MRLQTTVLIFLMLGMSITPLISADSTISTTTTWSGTIVLSGNVTVDSSTTLVIEPDTVVDAQSYWLQIDGILEAEDAEFMTTLVPTSLGSTGAGLWGGISISSTGSATLTNTSISGAESALKVYGDATVHESITVTNSYVGFDVASTGTLSAENVTMSTIDIQSIVNHGVLAINTGLFTNTATGIHSTNDLTANDVSFFDTGFAIDVVSGTAGVVGLGLDNVSVGIGSDSGASTTVSSIYGQHVALAVDGTDADDLLVSNALISGDRLLWGTMNSITLSDINFTQVDAERSVADVRCLVKCTFDNIHLHNTDVAMDVDGPGSITVANSTIYAEEIGLRASGTGLLSMESTTLISNGTALSLSSIDSELSHSTVSLNDGIGPAVKLLEGHHQWDDVDVTKPYNNFDTESTGIDAWYTTITASSIATNGFAYGVDLEDSTLSAGIGAFVNGNVRGIHAVDSQIHVGDLTTTAQEQGLVLSELSTAIIEDWTANLHNSPLLLEDGSAAHVRTFTPLNTAQSSSDALGDGLLLYGGPTTSTISTTEYGYLHETYVSFVDADNQPVQATADAYGFSTLADTNGIASLPLLASGTHVEVLYDGQGVSKELFGNQQGQTVQIVTLPEGDWNLPASSTIVLGARPDGQPHLLNGNLVFGTQSQLKLVDTTLIVDASSSVDLGPSGTLSGDNGVLNATSLTLSVQSTLSSEGGGLEVQSPVQWSCSQPQTVSNIRFMASVTLSPLCEVEMIGGQADVAISIGSGASFSLISTVNIEVLDKGIPVEGATIIVGGQTVQTNSAGQATAQTTARTVNAQGDVQEGTKTVTMQIGSFTEFYAWDTKQSTSHTFMASTVPNGVVTSWLILEETWSPYRLEGDLTIASTTRMTVNDGVELRIASDAVIDVNGVLEAGAATISSTGFGARWGGLLLDGVVGSRIDLSGTTLVEGSPLVTFSGLGELSAQGAQFARSAGADPLFNIHASAQSTLTLIDSELRDAGSMCIQSQSEDSTIVLERVTLSDCNGDGIWARLSSIQVRNISLEGGIEDGIDLIGVTGQISGVQSDLFNGDYVVRLQSIEERFHFQDSTIHAGAEGGIFASKCSDVVLSNLTVIGAPAIDLDETSGAMHNIVLQGQDSGIGLTIRHGLSEPIVGDSIQISDYSIGLKLHAHGFEEPSPAVMRNISIDSIEAISAELFDLRVESSTTNGNISIASSTIKAVDSTLTGAILLDSDGLLSEWTTHSLQALLGGEVVAASYSLTSDMLSAPIEVSGSFIDVEMLYKQTTGDGSTSAAEATATVVSALSLPTTKTFLIGKESPAIIQIPLIANTPPTLSILSPNSGQRYMETTPVEVSVTVTDDTTEPSEVTLSWAIFDAQNNLVDEGQSGTNSFNITSLQTGLFVIQLSAEDNLGLVTIAEVDIEITQLDTDGDWTSTCSSETWFDGTTGLQCGPDIYDPDDDNDGRLDSDDAWPKDPCAWIDTDEDGQPDTIECPEGMSTTLFEDQDDDGNGILDESERMSLDTSDGSATPLILVASIVILVLLVFILRIRGGGPKTLGEIDERML